jgi:hypothetical protein
MANTINADNGVVSSIPGLKYSADTSGVLILQTNTTDALTLDTTQGATFSTGVLVTNPYAGSYSGGMVLDHTTSLGRISVAASSAIAFYNGGISARVETMRIDASGNVGIGTASPYAKLSVTTTNGNLGFTGGNTSGGSKIQAFGATSTSNGYLAFEGYTAEWMRIDSSGNVGIGKTNPSQKLDVSGNLQVQGTNSFVYVDAGGASGSALKLEVTGSTSVAVGADSNHPLLFKTNATERMRITSSGSLLIGTTAEADKFTVNGNMCLNTSIGYVFSNGGGSAGSVNAGIGLDGGGNTLRFYTGGAANERMRIDSSGNLLVGTTASQSISGISSDHTFVGTTNTNRWICAFINSSASSPYGIGINYTGSAPNATGNQSIFFRDTGGTRFEVRSNGGIANYSANNVNLSDAREKTNVELAGSYLDKICAIPVKTFNYIDQNQEEDPGLTLGVIAQDVEAVAPELVMESNWGTEETPKMRLSIYQTDLQYALMKCIQEQQDIITQLQLDVAALKANKP